MRRPAAALAIALTSLGLAAPPAPGVVCDRTITIASFSFTPRVASKLVQDELIVCWHNGDGVTHTATSNTKMFDTGAIASGADATARLYGSGVYRYHCSIHPSMTGTFTVRPAVSDVSITLGQSFTLTVGDRGVIADPPTWDVQRRRNDGPWITFKTATPDASFAVKPSRPGTFRYRARTHLPGHVSGWSPVRKVVVSSA